MTPPPEPSPRAPARRGPLARIVAAVERRGLRGAAHGVLTSGLSMGLSSVFNYLVIIVLARIATRAEVGTFGYIISAATILATLCEFGTTNALTRALPTVAAEERSRLLAMSFSLRFVVSLVVGLACIATLERDLVWTGILLLLWPGDTLLLYLNARLDFNRAAVLRLVNSALYFGGAVGLYVLTGDEGWASFARGLSFLVAGGFVATGALSRAAFRGWTWTELKGQLKLSLDYFAISSVTTIFGHADVVLVGWFLSADELGLFRPILTLGILPIMVGTLVRIPLNAIISAGRETDAATLRQKAHALTVVIGGMGVLLVVFGVAFAPWVVRVTLGEGYVEGADVFRVVLVASGVRTLITAHHSFILMRSRPSALLLISVVATVVLVVLDVLTIPWLGVRGPAWARLVAESVLAVGVVWHFYRTFLPGLGR